MPGALWAKTPSPPKTGPDSDAHECRILQSISDTSKKGSSWEIIFQGSFGKEQEQGDDGGAYAAITRNMLVRGTARLP